jgi:3-hydroxyacyl-CoA dehydrogenase
MTGPIAIIGCGLIGESWAALMTAYGLDVRLWDPAPIDRSALAGRLARARAQVCAVSGIAPLVEGKITVATTLAEAVSGALWIQENAPEQLALKRDLYEAIEETAGNDAIVASSTTALTWSELTASMRRPERFLTAHPFSPPHLMPLVEIYTPDAALRETARAFYAGLGRHPVLLDRDAIGHIANRLAAALWREAVHIVAEGIASVAAVDEALVHGPGLRWSVVGSHMAYHLGGGPGGLARYLEQLGPSQERRWAALGDPRLTPELRALLIDGVERTASGRSVAELTEERDAALIRVLNARPAPPDDTA